MVITIGRVFRDSLAAYAPARLRFPRRRLVFALIIGTLAVPDAVLFFVFQRRFTRGQMSGGVKG